MLAAAIHMQLNLQRLWMLLLITEKIRDNEHGYYTNYCS
jgi:hypothetical protein